MFFFLIFVLLCVPKMKYNFLVPLWLVKNNQRFIILIYALTDVFFYRL
jgi:hypothetical protein